jgi:hypothetical protein
MIGDTKNLLDNFNPNKSDNDDAVFQVLGVIFSIVFQIGLR